MNNNKGTYGAKPSPSDPSLKPFKYGQGVRGDTRHCVSQHVP